MVWEEAMKIFTIAHVPPELVQAWLQHVRYFDVAHPGCRFEVGIDGPEESFETAISRLIIEPELTFSQIFERKKKDE
jgi:hypothetical protein